MKTRIRTRLERLRGSYWFLPSLMLAGAVILSVVMVELDHRFETAVSGTLGWAYGGGADGARGLLSTVAGSMITVAGVVFSITLVALSIASAQFGPRLLRNFMTDVGNQLVLGTFVSTFLYSLLVLRTVRGGAGEAGSGNQGVFVPELSVTVAVVLAIVGIIVLVYFIHHVASSVQVETAIRDVGAKLGRAIDHLFPEESSGTGGEYEGELRSEDDIPDDFRQGSEVVVTEKSGYVQTIRSGRLADIGAERDVVVRLDVQVGSFLPIGAEVLRVWPSGRLTDEVREEVLEAVGIGSERLHRMDVEFYTTQLVEIAILALSPGVNQSFTAMSCIEELGNVLARLANRGTPFGYRYDADGNLRVIAQRLAFPQLLGLSFDMIRRNSLRQVAVGGRLLEILAVLAGLVTRDDDRQAIYYQASMVLSGMEEELGSTADLQQIRTRYQAVLRALGMETPQAV